MGNSYANFIESVYRKNGRAIIKSGRTKHNLRIDVKEYNIDRSEITFDNRDMPYFKLALVDRHLDEVE